MDKTDKSSFVEQGVVNPQYTPIQTNQYFVPCQIPYAQQPYKKLFVGQIPKTFSEEDVKKIFSSTCQVYAAHIIKDRVTREHRGCAFIYVDPSVADLVKEKYHNKYCCPKMTNKLQVRDANLPQRYHQNEVFTGEFQYQIPQMQFSSPIQTSPDAVPTSEISQNSTSLPENTSNPSSTTPSSNSDMTNSSSPTLIQQTPNMYSLPYYPMMSQNLVYSPMIIPMNSSSETASEPTSTPIMPSIISPMQPVYFSYMPVQQSSSTPVQSTGDNSTVPVMMTSNGYFLQYPSYPINQPYSPLSSPPTTTGEKPRKDISPEANLFVFNLPPEYDDDKLRELFSPFGEILSAKVIFEKETNTSKGYGFVNFYNEEDAKKAIKEMDGKVINKKKLTVQVKKPKSR